MNGHVEERHGEQTQSRLPLSLHTKYSFLRAIYIDSLELQDCNESFELLSSQFWNWSLFVSLSFSRASPLLPARLLVRASTPLTSSRGRWFYVLPTSFSQSPVHISLEKYLKVVDIRMVGSCDHYSRPKCLRANFLKQRLLSNTRRVTKRDANLLVNSVLLLNFNLPIASKCTL